MADALLKEVQDGIADLFKEKPSLVECPYVNVDKSSVLQAARDFHDSNIVKENPKECIQTIAKLLYLQNNTSQQLLSAEATEVFFGITKLFVSNDAKLRRMVYVILKELYLLCDPSDVIIITSCLTKDMTCDVDLYRANALRVLVRIIDSAMLGAIERYVKQAIIHKSPTVASSALVSSLFLFQKSLENASIVKRWIGEVNEAMDSPNQMVQFHATQLFYQIKSSDRLAVSKFVQKYSGIVTDTSSSVYKVKSKVKSPLAMVCLVRYAGKLLHEEVTEGRAAPDASIMNATELCNVGYRFLESCLRHESEMVSFEAAKTICMLPTQSAEVVFPAFSVLQLSLSSTKRAMRLAGVKLLFGVASLHPNLVARFNEGLEALIGDSNRLVGTLAIMTLLKTGTESSMDRLLKNMSAFFYQIAEEYRIMVVQSLERLCITFPSKSRIVIGFMSRFLREEGGFAFKRRIVESIVSLMGTMPELREMALFCLCEFIEDCEFVALSTEILYILGDNGPKSSSPARYVRFIYNRCILETAMVRAAAVSALSKFAACCPELRGAILPLLTSCLQDENDETRDRAAIAIHVFEGLALVGDSAVASNIEVNDNFTSEDEGRDEGFENNDSIISSQEKQARDVLATKLPLSFDNLAQRLRVYRDLPGAMQDPEPLALDSLPVVENKSLATNIQHLASSSFGEGSTPGLPDTREMNKGMVDPSTVIYSIPEFTSFGRVFRSCTPMPLTESESEYVVTCTKHILDKHIILQFIVQNTIEDQRMENVFVATHTDSSFFEMAGELPATCITYGSTASCFAILEKGHDLSQLETTVFQCELKFTVITVDPESGEDLSSPVEEEYPLENLEIYVADFVSKTVVPDFRNAWESLGSSNEILQKFGLAEKTIPNAVNDLIECLGMQTCDGTSTAVKPGARQHMLHLCGTFCGNIRILARCQIGFGGNNCSASSPTIILKMAIRSESSLISRLLLDSIC
jgi:coatomer protein complex subunit gamma